MEIKERVKLYCKTEGISVSEFEKKSKLGNGYVSKLKLGFGSLKLDNIRKAFPNLNLDWIKYEEGEMYVNYELEPKTDISLNSYVETYHINNKKMSFEEYEQIIRLQAELVEELRQRMKFQENLINELLTKIK